MKVRAEPMTRRARPSGAAGGRVPVGIVLLVLLPLILMPLAAVFVFALPGRRARLP